MRRDENIRESKKARQLVVLQNLAGKIFEKDAFLLLVDVESYAADLAALQSLD